MRKKLDNITLEIMKYVNLKRNAKKFEFYNGVTFEIFEWLVQYVPNRTVANKLTYPFTSFNEIEIEIL